MARGLDPLAPPDWPYAHGNRFDDPGEVDGISPEARFRVVYCASERVCAFAETVARFRPNLRALAGIRAASDDPDIASVLRPGLITEDWRLKRRVGTIVLDPPLRFVDIADAETLAALRDVFAPLAVALGLPDFDLSAVTSAHRLLTQRIARPYLRADDRRGRAAIRGHPLPVAARGRLDVLGCVQHADTRRAGTSRGDLPR